METNNPWVRFLPAWVIANTFGWMAYIIIYVFPFFKPLAAICIGLLIAALQWVVLTRYIDVDSLWIWASLLPYGLLLFIITWFEERISLSAWLIAEGIILGALGYLQCSILRNYVNFALVWVVASPLAAVLGTVIARAGNRVFFPQEGGSLIFLWGVMGLIYGCITGITLLALVNSEDI